MGMDRRHVAGVRHQSIAVVIATVTLVGCGSGREATPVETVPRTATATASVSPSPSRPPAPPPLDGAGPGEGEASPIPPDVDSAEQAQARATAFMRAFARTDLPQQQWWAGVGGYFTPAAAAIYQSTDVANVPVHQVTEGSAQLLPGTTKFRAEVSVDTDNGAYTVTLIRAGGTWLVDRATPPKS